MARNAEKNNEKLFPIFRKNLADGVLSTYTATADKLTGWLSRDKAYYPHARPMIVDLLETAHAQVRRASGTPDQPFHISRCPDTLRPWAEPFIKLIRTVCPFFPMFTEPHLQARLRALIQTIDSSTRSAPLQLDTKSPIVFRSPVQPSHSPHSVFPVHSPHVQSPLTSGPVSLPHGSGGAPSPGIAPSMSGWSPQPSLPGRRSAQGVRMLDPTPPPTVKPDQGGLDQLGRPIPRASVGEMVPRTSRQATPTTAFAPQGSAQLSPGTPVSVPIPLPRLKSGFPPLSRSASAADTRAPSIGEPVSAPGTSSPVTSPAASVPPPTVAASPAAVSPIVPIAAVQPVTAAPVAAVPPPAAGPSSSSTPSTAQPQFAKKARVKAKKKPSVQDDFILADLRWYESAKRQSAEKSPIPAAASVTPSTPTVPEQKWNGTAKLGPPPGDVTSSNSVWTPDPAVADKTGDQTPVKTEAVKEHESVSREPKPKPNGTNDDHAAITPTTEQSSESARSLSPTMLKVVDGDHSKVVDLECRDSEGGSSVTEMTQQTPSKHDSPSRLSPTQRKRKAMKPRRGPPGLRFLPKEPMQEDKPPVTPSEAEETVRLNQAAEAEMNASPAIGVGPRNVEEQAAVLDLRALKRPKLRPPDVAMKDQLVRTPVKREWPSRATTPTQIDVSFQRTSSPDGDVQMLDPLPPQNKSPAPEARSSQPPATEATDSVELTTNLNSGDVEMKDNTQSGKNTNSSAEVPAAVDVEPVVEAPSESADSGLVSPEVNPPVAGASTAEQSADGEDKPSKTSGEKAPNDSPSAAKTLADSLTEDESEKGEVIQDEQISDTVTSQEAGSSSGDQAHPLADSNSVAMSESAVDAIVGLRAECVEPVVDDASPFVTAESSQANQKPRTPPDSVSRKRSRSPSASAYEETSRQKLRINSPPPRSDVVVDSADFTVAGASQVAIVNGGSGSPTEEIAVDAVVSPSDHGGDAGPQNPAKGDQEPSMTAIEIDPKEISAVDDLTESNANPIFSQRPLEAPSQPPHSTHASPVPESGSRQASPVAEAALSNMDVDSNDSDKSLNGDRAAPLMPLSTQSLEVGETISNQAIDEDRIEEGEISRQLYLNSSPALSASDIAQPANGEGVSNEPMTTSPLDSDMLVLGCMRGTSDPDILFEFNVSAEQAALLSRWVTRYETKEDVSSSRCLTFVCCPFSECIAKARMNPDMSLEELTAGVSIIWPTDGRLWAQLKNDKGENHIMLSPPFMPKTEIIVDLSKSVCVGKNILRLYQLRDHSECVFAVRLHCPTQPQLDELKRRRDHDENWQNFLRSMRKFDIPIPPFLNDGASVDVPTS